MEDSNAQHLKTLTKVGLWAFTLILFYSTCIGQVLVSKSPAVQVTFSYQHPRFPGLTSFTDYVADGWVHEMTQKGQRDITCLYTVGFAHFRLSKTNTIDSIRIEGRDLPDFLFDFLEAKIRSSQQYWRCKDCDKKGGIYITMPIDVDFGGPCNNRLDLLTVYKAAVDSVSQSYKNGKPSPVSKAKFVGYRQLLFTPFFLIKRI